MIDGKAIEISFVIKGTFAGEAYPEVALYLDADIKDSEGVATDFISTRFCGSLSDKLRPFANCVGEYSIGELKVLQFRFNDFFDKCIKIAKDKKK